MWGHAFKSITDSGKAVFSTEVTSSHILLPLYVTFCNLTSRIFNMPSSFKQIHEMQQYGLPLRGFCHGKLNSGASLQH
jgi:hypothetical protein